jgi:hypothetical protein
MDSTPGEWRKQFAVNVGYLTVGLARFGVSFFHVPPEATAALAAIDGGEVGVYQVKELDSRPDFAGILRIADKSMQRRGWERIVGVVDGKQFVAVYAPTAIHGKKLSCCIAVLDEQNLVVVSARGNISPLLQLAQGHLHEKGRLLSDFR